MAQLSSIEWTDATWNPVTGCTKISPGCTHCYAERIALRLQAMEQPRYHNGFKLTLQPDLLEQPLRWKTPKLVFVNSMSDLFHRDVPVDFIRGIFEIMRKAHWHVFQVLTKRADRLADFFGDLLVRAVRRLRGDFGIRSARPQDVEGAGHRQARGGGQQPEAQGPFPWQKHGLTPSVVFECSEVRPAFSGGRHRFPGADSIE